MHQLSELRFAWSSVQHQRDTLQTIYGSHSELVKALASNPMRYPPVFHLEDFFDRYGDLGPQFDGAHLSLVDINVDAAQERYQGHNLYANRPSNASMTNGPSETASNSLATKRKASSSGRKKHENLKVAHRSNSHPVTQDQMMTTNNLLEGNISMHQQMVDPNVALQQPPTPFTPSSATITTPSQTPFSPQYNFSALSTIPQSESFDSVFGMPQMSYGYSNNNMIMGGTRGGISGSGEGMTPGGRSNGESTGTNEGEKDPFLSLLEQLAENEHSRGGPSELDFFLSGGNG
jgi:hypothetical protein